MSEKQKYERRADFMDTVGKAGNYLFARNPQTGHRITARRFYGLKGEDSFEREGYVLMTTRKKRD